jgi:ATP-dependent Clp protease ATP-binding subunit ClpA
MIDKSQLLKPLHGKNNAKTQECPYSTSLIKPCSLLGCSRVEVEKILGFGNEISPNEMGIPFTSPAKRLLELSLEECRLAKKDSIQTQHILLALLREHENNVADKILSLFRDKNSNAAIEMLKNLGIDHIEFLDMVLQSNIDQETTM